MRQRSQAHFRPDGAPIKLYGSCHRNLQGYPIWPRKKNCSRASACRLVTSGGTGTLSREKRRAACPTKFPKRKVARARPQFAFSKREGVSELCDRLEWTYSSRVVVMMKMKTPGIADTGTHLWP